MYHYKFILYAGVLTLKCQQIAFKTFCDCGTPELAVLGNSVIRIWKLGFRHTGCRPPGRSQVPDSFGRCLTLCVGSTLLILHRLHYTDKMLCNIQTMRR